MPGAFFLLKTRFIAGGMLHLIRLEYLIEVKCVEALKAMSISIRDVEHVANLARLHLTEEEKHIYVKQLNTLLGLVDKLNELETEQVTPTSHPFQLVNVMRDDLVKDMLQRDTALKNAPDKENGQFRVPAVLEGSGGA